MSKEEERSMPGRRSTLSKGCSNNVNRNSGDVSDGEGKSVERM